MIKDTLGDRMKQNYEAPAKSVLPLRMPVVVRIDGKAFHSYCRHLSRPFCEPFIDVMDAAMLRLCTEMQGAVLGYAQSDEISVLLHNYKRLASAAWFDNEVQKIVSVSASIAAAVVTAASPRLFDGETRLAFFDARVFVIPEAEVCNYFLWRQQDASRNSVAMVAQSMYSAKDLHGKDVRQQQEMIFQKSGQNWNDLPVRLRRGRCAVRTVFDTDSGQRSAWTLDNEIPVFSADRTYVEQHLAVEPEDPRPVPRFGQDGDR